MKDNFEDETAAVSSMDAGMCRGENSIYPGKTVTRIFLVWKNEKTF
jgi:hypothetical protein